MARTVIEALRRFLPQRRLDGDSLNPDQRRAIRAMQACRTSAMGGELYACSDCGEQHFAFHSCNHKACPQCGKADTARWVQRELDKRVVGAPYFMVNFTVPTELRSVFRGPQSKRGYDLLFHTAAQALSKTLALRRSLGAQVSGFTGILHTWNQRLLFVST